MGRLAPYGDAVRPWAGSFAADIGYGMAGPGGRGRPAGSPWGGCRVIKVVSWNIGKREMPWRELVRMAREGDADLALLQEARSRPEDLVNTIEYVDRVFWNRQLYDRWPLVVKLSDRITVEPYRQVPPTSDLGEDAIGVSGIGTIAAGRVIPRDDEEEAFVAISMYARWLSPHPSTKSSWSVGYSDASAHRIISDRNWLPGVDSTVRGLAGQVRRWGQAFAAGR